MGACPSNLLLLLPRFLPSLCHAGEELGRHGATRSRPYFTRVESQSARCCSEVCASHCGVKGQLIHRHQLLGPGGEGDGDCQLRAIHPLDFQSDIFPVRYNPPASHYTRVHDDIIFTVLFMTCKISLLCVLIKGVSSFSELNLHSFSNTCM